MLDEIIKQVATEVAPEVVAKAAESNDFENAVHSFAEYKDNLPNRKPEIIAGVLRQSHKMMIAAPSKAGKSFTLIHLAIAFAEGREWLGRKCAQSRVLYLNMEIDEASFFHRIAQVYNELGWGMNYTGNLFVKSLRGKTALDWEKLIVNWAKTCAAEVIIFDPIYKMGLDNENDAGQIGQLCALFDAIAEQSGASIIYAHHYAKGNSAVKASIDRASGSGVFARDADALITLSPLERDGLGDDDGYRAEFTLREFAYSKPVSLRKKSGQVLLQPDRALDVLPLLGSSSGLTVQAKMKKDAEAERAKADKKLDKAHHAAQLLKPGEAIGKTEFINKIVGSLIATGHRDAQNIAEVCIQQNLVIQRSKNPEDKIKARLIIERPDTEEDTEE